MNTRMNELNTLLATVSVVAQNVKSRHWTLVGPRFKSWHILLDDIYKDLAKHGDNIAELMVQRGINPVIGMGNFLSMSLIPDLSTRGGWRTYVAETAAELGTIIGWINERDALGGFDAAASNDLAQIASELYHWRMFCTQSLAEE